MSQLDFLLQFLQTFDEGQVFLPYGVHVHKIHTRGTPKQIWLSEVDTGNLPVCQGDVTTYGVTKLPDGFILYIDVKTDYVSLEWQAILESKQ